MFKPPLRRVVEEHGRLRATARALACSSGLLFLAACGGGGGGDPGGSSNVSGPGGDNVGLPGEPCTLSASLTDRDWSDCSYQGNFDLTNSINAQNDPEYRYADASFNNPTGLVNSLTSKPYGTFTGQSQSNPYNLINLATALGANLTGAGKVVAVLDNGFRTTHQELSGKIVGSYGTIGIADHGTHVAALIAGRKDGNGMHGVAPGASLFLSDWAHGNNGLSVNLQWMAASIEAAADAGAIAHNNSWGWTGNNTVSHVVAEKTDSNSYFDAISEVIGFAPADWQSYVGALDHFQQSGVVVFAASNNESLAGSDVSSAMPIFFPELEEAWIKAINGYFEVDASNNIIYAQRLSSPCAEMATMCIAGDGTTFSARSGSDTSYGAGTGTSYVAPQISGAIALVSQAFPSLSPAELTDRLLASANNQWFESLGIFSDGQVNFGNGIFHSYDDEWGMGTLDIAAALDVIGSLTVATGENLSTAQRTLLSNASISPSAAFGDGLETALDGVDMAVFDSLNGDFRIDAGDLVQAGGDSLLDRITKAGATARRTGGDGDGADFDDRFAMATFGSGHRTVTARMGFAEDVGAFTGATTAKAELGDSSVLSLTDGAFVASADRQFGRLGFSAYAFTGGHDDLEEGMVSGVGASLSFAAGSGKISLGLNQLAEQGALLGLEGNDSFDFGEGGNIGSVNVGVEQPIGQRLSLFAGAELGLAASTGLAGTGLVNDVDTVAFSGVTVGASLAGVLTKGDRLTLSAAQPLRVESGSVALNLPVGRDQDGNILYSAVDADLTPSGREIDISLAYDLNVRDAASLKLGLYYALDAGHVAGAEALGLAAFYRTGF